MQKFQLVDARTATCSSWCRRRCCAGRRSIAFDIDADDMRMRFDGAVLHGEELDELWGSIFADGDERLLRGVRQLALG
jgi:hypothetical protein